MGDSYTFSAEELMALCALRKVPALPGLRGTSINGLSDESRALVIGTAIRGLAARDLLVGDTGTEIGTGTDGERVTAMLELAAEPAVRVIVSRSTGETTRLTHLAARPDGAVEQTWDGSELHVLTSFDTPELYRRALGAAELGEGAGEEQAPVQTTVGAILLAEQALSQQDEPVAAAALRSSTVAPDAAERVAAALAQRRATVEVSTSYGTVDGPVQSHFISWLDCGQAGLWEKEGPPPPDTAGLDDREAAEAVMELPVRIQPRSAQYLAERIRAGLPS